jgi:hypothetical protein
MRPVIVVIRWIGVVVERINAKAVIDIAVAVIVNAVWGTFGGVPE